LHLSFLDLTPAGWLLLFHFALKKLPPVQEALGLKWVLIYDIAGCLHGLACCRMPCRCACMHMLPGLRPCFSALLGCSQEA